ncbi:MAG: hypothetical protein SPL49_04695 [Oribacterium sp.]|nr:hypothetical protein [Oribacterium sp.]
MKKLGIRVIFEKESLDSGDEKSELLFSILATIAQEESRSISTNLQWSRVDNLPRENPFQPGMGIRRSIHGRRHFRNDHVEAPRLHADDGGCRGGL